MLLRQVRDLLREQGEATLDALTYALKADSGIVEQALQDLVDKGKVVKITRENPCSGSRLGCSCPSLDKNIPVYQWIG
jgi:predicted transcriptional regulator